MATAVQTPVRVPDGDDLEELPPLDGDAGDGGDDRAEEDEELPGSTANAGDLDDATGEDDPADASELDVDENDKDWLGEAQDAGDLDLGDDDVLEIRDEGASFVEAEEPGVAAGDSGLEDVAEVSGLDTGEEGPLDEDEDLRDEDLPSLDADAGDDGEGVDASVVDEHFAVEQPLGLTWAERPFERVGAPVALVSAAALACTTRGALVAGRTSAGSFDLLQVDLEGESRSLPSAGLDGMEVTALAVEEGVIAAVLGDGQVLVSRDGGARFERQIDGLVGTHAVIARGALWVRTPARGLAVSVGGGPFQRRSVAGAVAALSADGESGVMALTVDGAGIPVAILRGRPDGSIDAQSISAPEACSGDIVAARGGFVAYPGHRGVVRLGADGEWRVTRWEGAVTALSFVDDKGSLVAATYSEADDTTALVVLDESGRASVVARLGPARSDGDLDGRALSVACDGARDVIWVAGGFGVAAFAIR